MRVIVLHPFTKFEVRRTCHYDDAARLIPGHKLSGLVTLTFDLSTSKWGYGSPYRGLPFYQFSASYTLPFSTYGSGTGQTDGQTTV